VPAVAPGEKPPHEAIHKAQGKVLEADDRGVRDDREHAAGRNVAHSECDSMEAQSPWKKSIEQRQKKTDK
jgi:hypothetical protein